MRSVPGCGEWGCSLLPGVGFAPQWLLLLCVEHRLLDVWASVIAARRLQQLWLVGLLPCSVCDLRGSGMEPVSPVEAGGFLTIGPPGKSLHRVLSPPSEGSLVQQENVTLRCS